MFFIANLPSYRVVIIRLAAASVFGPFGSRNPLFEPTLDRRTLTVAVGEDEQGEVDLNGNGILFEDVPFAVHVCTGKARLAEFYGVRRVDFSREQWLA